MHPLAAAATNRTVSILERSVADSEKHPHPVTPFKDELRIPPIVRPVSSDEGVASLTIRSIAAKAQLHSELPPSDVWTYEGHLPGPTIEVRRGQHVRVEWVNDLPRGVAYPVSAVSAENQVPEGGGARSERVVASNCGRSSKRLIGAAESPG